MPEYAHLQGERACMHQPLTHRASRFYLPVVAVAVAGSGNGLRTTHPTTQTLNKYAADAC